MLLSKAWEPCHRICESGLLLLMTVGKVRGRRSPGATTFPRAWSRSCCSSDDARAISPLGIAFQGLSQKSFRNISSLLSVLFRSTRICHLKNRGTPWGCSARRRPFITPLRRWARL